MVSNSATTLKGLAIVTGAGWLTFFQLRRLECTCLYVCRESRRQVGRKVRVAAETPRSLWRGETTDTAAARGNNTDPDPGSGRSSADRAGPNKKTALPVLVATGRDGGGHRVSSFHKFSWHGGSNRSGGSSSVAPAAVSSDAAAAVAADAVARTPAANKAATGPSPAAPSAASPSRVPPIRATFINWLLPATELLSPGFVWPRGVKELQFGPKFDEMIHQILLPDTLEGLTFGYNFSHSLGPGRVRWPSGLKRLKLGATWNRRLTGARDSWPASLEVLEFGTGFDRPLRGGNGIGLPPGLREINLGGVFNFPLEGVEWPAGLRRLTLSEFFDQPLAFGDGGSAGVSFPRGLREIHFGGRFNQDVSRTAWPESLAVLTFGDKFNRAFAAPTISGSYDGGGYNGGGDSGSGGGGGGGGGGGCDSRGPGGATAAAANPSRSCPPPSFLLPPGLKLLILGDGFNQPLSGGELPDGLEKLVIGKAFVHVSSVRWPVGLKRLELSCEWGANSGGGDEVRRINHWQSWLILPPQLEYLDAGDRFNSSLDKIVFPATLRVLVLGAKFSQPLDQMYSVDLYNRWVDASRQTSTEATEAEEGGGRGGHSNLPGFPPPLLPAGLEELRLGAAFRHTIEGVRLPRRLKRLLFAASSQFDSCLAGVLWPPGLEELRFGNNFAQRLDDASATPCHGRLARTPAPLPASLRELSFGWNFSYSLQGVDLPRGLRRLSFAARYPMSHVRGLEWPPALQSIVVGSFNLRSREDVARWASQPPF